MTIRDRALGAWYGQLIGDNLGALVEFRRPGEIAAAYPDGVARWPTAAHNIAAGQPRRLEMALALARSLVRNGVRPRRRRLYRRWYDSTFDISAISGALRQFNENSRRAARSCASPVAIAYLRPRHGRVARAHRPLTHPNSYCLDVNAVWTGVLAA